MSKYLHRIGLLLMTCASILMFISFTLPWWIGDFTITDPGMNEVRIYGWGLRQSLVGLGSAIEHDLTPMNQTILAWAYIAISIIALFLGLTLTRKWSYSLLLSTTSGIGYISYALVSVYVVIQNRLDAQGIALQGKSYIPTGYTFIEIYTSIQMGFYLAIGTGVCIVLSSIFYLP